MDDANRALAKATTGLERAYAALLVALQAHALAMDDCRKAHDVGALSAPKR